GWIAPAFAVVGKWILEIRDTGKLLGFLQQIFSAVNFAGRVDDEPGLRFVGHRLLRRRRGRGRLWSSLRTMGLWLMLGLLLFLFLVVNVLVTIRIAESGRIIFRICIQIQALRVAEIGVRNGDWFCRPVRR